MQELDWTKPHPVFLIKEGKTAIKVAEKLRILGKLTENGEVYQKWTSISTSLSCFHQT